MTTTELIIENIQVHESGENIKISLSSQGGDQRDLLLSLEHLDKLIEMLIRTRLDASVAKATQHKSSDEVSQYRPPSVTLHVKDLNIVKWETGGAAFQLETIEGGNVVVALMPEKIRFIRETLRKHFEGPGKPPVVADDPPTIGSPIFPGQAPWQEEFKLKDPSGVDIDPSFAVFPLVKRLPGEHYEFIATGFFISENGLFASARHVLDELSEDQLPSNSTLFGVHFLPEGQYVLRSVVNYATHDVADVGAGKLADAKDQNGNLLKSSPLVLTRTLPEIGDWVFTYAYPHATQSLNKINFSPRFYSGQLEEEHPTGRDRHMMPGPCCRTSMVIHGGASGGPVFGRNGRVFGINSTGYDESTLSYVSRVIELLEVELDQVRFSDTEEASRVALGKLASMNHILVR